MHNNPKTADLKIHLAGANHVSPTMGGGRMKEEKNQTEKGGKRKGEDKQKPSVQKKKNTSENSKFHPRRFLILPSLSVGRLGSGR